MEEQLEVYKPELRKLLWPIFVYSLLSMVQESYPRAYGDFFNRYQDRFVDGHDKDLHVLGAMRDKAHLDNQVAQIYLKNKYRITLSSMAGSMLYQFLESKDSEGGQVIVKLITEHLFLIHQDRTTMGNERTLAAMMARGSRDFDMPAEDEGIPGHNPGSANTDPNAPPVLTKVQLGQLPMDPEAMDDVRASLQEEDARNPPAAGQNSLVEEFEQRIKQEPLDEAPGRDQVPLPPPLARDVAMEVQRIKENRDRFRIEGRTGGVGPGVSVCMFTFHNTYDR